MKDNKHRRLAIRTAAGVLLTAFTLQDIGTGAPYASGFAARVPYEPALPRLVGKVESTYRHPGSDTMTIYLIQDAHVNESAQRSIISILARLIKDRRMRHIFLEAGTGDDSISHWRRLAPRETRRRVADRFLAKGYLQAAEYLDLTSDLDLQLWGVEDRRLYRRSVRLYAQLKRLRQERLDALDRMDATIRSLEPDLLSPEALSLRTAYRQLQTGKMALTEYLLLLNREAERVGLPRQTRRSLACLDAVVHRERKIDFEAAGREQVAVVAALSAQDRRRMQEIATETDQPPLSSGLRKAGIQQERQRIFYDVLRAKIRNRRSYPNLARYLGYLDRAALLEAEKCVRERVQVEKDLFAAYCRTPAQMRIVASVKAVETLRGLFGLTLTSDEAMDIESNPLSYDATAIAGFLNAQIMHLGRKEERVVFLDPGFARSYAMARTFYRLARARDRSFVAQSVSKMSRDGVREAILIAGGHHARHLKSILRSRGLSYVAIVPVSTQETPRKLYERILLEGEMDGRSAGGSGAAGRFLGTRPIAEARSRWSEVIAAFPRSQDPREGPLGGLAAARLAPSSQRQRADYYGALRSRTDALNDGAGPDPNAASVGTELLPLGGALRPAEEAYLTKVGLSWMRMPDAVQLIQAFLGPSKGLTVENLRLAYEAWRRLRRIQGRSGIDPFLVYRLEGDEPKDQDLQRAIAWLEGVNARDIIVTSKKPSPKNGKVWRVTIEIRKRDVFGNIVTKFNKSAVGEPLTGQDLDLVAQIMAAHPSQRKHILIVGEQHKRAALLLAVYLQQNIRLLVQSDEAKEQLNSGSWSWANTAAKGRLQVEVLTHQMRGVRGTSPDPAVVLTTSQSVETVWPTAGNPSETPRVSGSTDRPEGNLSISRSASVIETLRAKIGQAIIEFNKTQPDPSDEFLGHCLGFCQLSDERFPLRWTAILEEEGGDRLRILAVPQGREADPSWPRLVVQMQESPADPRRAQEVVVAYDREPVTAEQIFSAYAAMHVLMSAVDEKMRLTARSEATQSGVLQELYRRSFGMNAFKRTLYDHEQSGAVLVAYRDGKDAPNPANIRTQWVQLTHSSSPDGQTRSNADAPLKVRWEGSVRDVRRYNPTDGSLRPPVPVLRISRGGDETEAVAKGLIVVVIRTGEGLEFEGPLSRSNLQAKSNGPRGKVGVNMKVGVNEEVITEILRHPMSGLALASRAARLASPARDQTGGNPGDNFFDRLAELSRETYKQQLEDLGPARFAGVVFMLDFIVSLGLLAVYQDGLVWGGHLLTASAVALASWGLWHMMRGWIEARPILERGILTPVILCGVVLRQFIAGNRLIFWQIVRHIKTADYYNVSADGLIKQVVFPSLHRGLIVRVSKFKDTNQPSKERWWLVPMNEDLSVTDPRRVRLADHLSSTDRFYPAVIGWAQETVAANVRFLLKAVSPSAQTNVPIGVYYDPNTRTLKYEKSEDSLPVQITLTKTMRFGLMRGMELEVTIVGERDQDIERLEWELEAALRLAFPKAGVVLRSTQMKNASTTSAARLATSQPSGTPIPRLRPSTQIPPAGRRPNRRLLRFLERLTSVHGGLMRSRQLPLNLRGERASCAVLSFKRTARGWVVVLGGGREFLLRTGVNGRAPRHAGGWSLNNLRRRDAQIIQSVRSITERSPSPSQQSAVIELDLGIFDIEDGRFDAYADYLIACVRRARSSGLLRKGTYVVATGENNQHLMNRPGAADVILSERPAGLEDAPTVLVALAESCRKDCINLPVSKLSEGDVPAFTALLGLAAVAAEVDPEAIPEGFGSAYGEMAGQRPSNQLLRLILKGEADSETLKRYALRPLARVSVQSAVRFFALVKKMAEQSA